MITKTLFHYLTFSLLAKIIYLYLYLLFKFQQLSIKK